MCLCRPESRNFGIQQNLILLLALPMVLALFCRWKISRQHDTQLLPASVYPHQEKEDEQEEEESKVAAAVSISRKSRSEYFPAESEVDGETEQERKKEELEPRTKTCLQLR